MPPTVTPPERLWYTGDAAADRLLAAQPLALLIGFVLDQQVTVQKAFSGPLELQQRLAAPLDAARLAAMDPASLAALFQARPALHRFPGAMAERVQAVCAAIVRDYDGDAARIWLDARDGADLRRRLLALPGVGDMKAASIIAVLARRFDLHLPGLEDVLPHRPTLGDVDSAESLAAYQAGKRAYKAMLRAGGTPADAGAAAMASQVRSTRP